MKIPPTSFLRPVTDLKEASVVNQNFVNLHSELQSLKRYIKNLPNSSTNVIVQENNAVSGFVTNLLLSESSFEKMGVEVLSFHHRNIGVPIGEEIFYIPDDMGYSDPGSYFFGTLPCLYISPYWDFGVVKTLFGFSAAIVDGKITDIQRNHYQGISIPTLYASRSVQAEYSGGYTLSAYIASFSDYLGYYSNYLGSYFETKYDGQGTMTIHLVSGDPNSGQFQVTKSWSTQFPVVASEKYKWTRHSLTIPISEIPEHSLGHKLFVIEFASTTPYLVDAVQLIPTLEQSIYYQEFGYPII